MAKSKKVIRTKYLYRKSKKKKAVSFVLFMLLIVILVGVGYLVTREWSERFGANAPSSSIPPVSIPSEEVSSAVISSEEQSSTPVAPTRNDLAMRMITADEIRQAGEAGLPALLENARANGYNGVCFELKDTDGLLAYTSQNPFAIEYGSVGEGAVSLEALVKAAQDAGMTPSAKVTALRDNHSAHAVNYQNSFAYQTPDGANWLDNSPANGGRAWLNPYMENARNYISGLCGEISAAGIKSIILTDVCFPYKNTQHLNEVNPFTTREKVLGQMMNEARAAAEDALVYAEFTPRTLAEHQVEGIRELGPYLAPRLDSAEAAEYEPVLREQIMLTDTPMTVSEVFGNLMLGDSFYGYEIDGQEVTGGQIVLVDAAAYESFWVPMQNDEAAPLKMSHIVY